MTDNKIVSIEEITARLNDAKKDGLSLEIEAYEDWLSDKEATIKILNNINKIILDCKSLNVKGDRRFTLKDYFKFKELEKTIKGEA